MALNIIDVGAERCKFKEIWNGTETEVEDAGRNWIAKMYRYLENAVRVVLGGAFVVGACLVMMSMHSSWERGMSKQPLFVRSFTASSEY